MSIPSINFFSEDIPFRLKQTKLIRKWIMTCVEQEGKKVGEISVIFCDDSYLLNINQSYLDHDTLTDIVTFDYGENKVISGDLFISIDRVRENAKKFKVSTSNELHRVIIHGVMHLCGYKDKTVKEASQMRKKENECLTLLQGAV